MRFTSRMLVFVAAGLGFVFVGQLAVTGADKLPATEPAGAAAKSALVEAPRVEAPPVEGLATVKQALQAESTGDNAARGRYLTKAFLAAPDLAEANWHLARVRVDDKWLPLGEAVARKAQDPLEDQYRKLRDKALGGAKRPGAKSLRDLARWCDKQGWTDRAKLHYAQLLAQPNLDDAARAEAIEKLDLVELGGKWLTRGELKEHEAEHRAIRDSLAKWGPTLVKLRQAIDGPDFAARDRAAKELAAIDDPRAIPALEAVLLTGGTEFQEHVVKSLARFPHFEATEALVRCAVLSDHALARDAAIAALGERPLHEIVPMLLDGLQAPLKAQYRLVFDSKGRISYSHAILREGRTRNQLLLAHALAVPQVSQSSILDQSDVKIVPNDTPNTGVKTEVRSFSSAAEAIARKRFSAAMEAENRQSFVALHNWAVAGQNRKLLSALTKLTGQQLPAEAPAWWDWWQQHNEYSYAKPTQYAFIGVSQRYEAQSHSYVKQSGTRRVGGSCFLAGTPVRSERGLVPIESLKPGDRVLAQHQDTGELAYRVVIRTTLRPPTKVLKLHMVGDAITATAGHPFWVNGKGWRMAKELAPGDLLHGLSGATPLDRIEAVPDQPAHNLVVEGFNTYFVGQSGLLVHDNEFREPTRSIVPGLPAE
jgi:hypothetical protein